MILTLKSTCEGLLFLMIQRTQLRIVQVFLKNIASASAASFQLNNRRVSVVLHVLLYALLHVYHVFSTAIFYSLSGVTAAFLVHHVLSLGLVCVTDG